MCIIGNSQTGLHMVTFVCDLQGRLRLKRSKLTQAGLVHTITMNHYNFRILKSIVFIFDMWCPSIIVGRLTIVVA